MKIDRTFIIPLKHFSILWSESEFAGTPQKTSPVVLGMFGGGGRGVVEKTTARPKYVVTYAVSRNHFLMDSKMLLKEKMKPRLVYKFFQSFGKNFSRVLAKILIGILKCAENVQIQ